MLRLKLLTATAAVALMAAPSFAFAQQATTAPAPTSPATTQSTPAAPMTQEAGPDAVAPTAPTPAAPPAAATTTPAPTAAPSQTASSAPASTTAAPTQTAQASTPASANTVIDVLKADGQFTTLVAALDEAQLTDTLKSQAAISIFAPTDAAFAALPEAERTRLMDPANVNELRQLLLYHVVVADVSSSQIKGTKGGVETAARSQVQLDGTGDAIRVDQATVTTADIDASNGAIFAIDKVLSPATSQVASGDAEEATEAAPPPAAPAPAETTDDAMTPPTTEAAVTPPPPASAPPAETAPATEAAPAATPAVPAPASPTTGSNSLNSPAGEPAVSTTTTASPPVSNPTDGQVDGTASDETESAEPDTTPGA